MRKTLIVLMTFALLSGALLSGAMAFETGSLVMKKCTSCHAVKGGKISRVEEIRTTPEEWAVIVDRMARLHGMKLEPGEMNTLVKELCSTQGLTSEEAAKVSYLDLYNNPQHVESPPPNAPEKLFVTCVRCHSAGKIYSYRMTEAEWAKMRDFHLYTTPTVTGQMREMRWISEADAVLAELAKVLPYGDALKPSDASPAGSWLILGYEPGKGSYRGHASIQEVGAGDFKVVGSLQHADGTSESFRGDASLYGNSAFRTNLRNNGEKTWGAFDFSDGVLQGKHHFAAPNFRTSTSTWYPQSGKAAVLRTTPGYLVAGETTTLLLEGTNLPSVTTGDIKVSGGNVKILSAKRLGPNAIEVKASYNGSGISMADLQVKGKAAGTLNLVPEVDYIAITPDLGRARVDSGPNFPAEGVQFDAIAYSNGSNTDDPADDIALGPVPAEFTLTELVTRPGDDELKWLGNISEKGTFIPHSDYGPITVREFHAEGTGLVRVNAAYERGGRSYEADARLVVTVPDYIPRIK